jgi:hypothetical protein
MMVCEVFASNRLAGNNTDYSAGDYFDAINSYYDSGGDKSKSVKWVASSLSDLEQRQIHPALPCSAHGRPVRQH